MDQSIKNKAAEFADIILMLRQRFNAEEVDFLKKTRSLSIVQLKVFLIIQTEQPCTMGEVAKKVPSLSLSSITVIVDKLVKEGLVDRVRSDTDRRVVRVQITEQGKDLYDSYRLVMVEMSTRLMGALDEDEQVFLLNTYRKIAALCKKADEK